MERVGEAPSLAERLPSKVLGFNAPHRKTKQNKNKNKKREKTLDLAWWSTPIICRGKGMAVSSWTAWAT